MKITALLFLFVSLSFIAPPRVYEWRGPERSGIYNEKGLMKSWPAQGPAELWSIDNLGNGNGSPTFTEDAFFITGETDSICSLFKFDLNSKMIWQTKLGREFMRSYPGSRSAPTIVDELVYIGTGMGNLFCIDRKTGKIIWSKDLEKDFGGILPLHGHSEAPLVDGEMIFWTPGGKQHNVVALNRLNGKLIWTNKGFGEASGYNQPKLIRHPSGNILVTFSSYHLMGFDTKSGQMLWSHEQDNYPVEKRGPGYGDTHCNTVIYENGSIWYAAGDGNCGVKLTLSADGKKITQAWRNKSFDSYMGGVVKIGNHLFCGSTTRPQLVSLDAATGILSDSLKVGTGALIAAENMLYYYNQKGEMMLLSCSNGDVEKVSSFKITKGTREHFAHPVINKGVLYVRHGKSLIAYNIKQS